MVRWFESLEISATGLTAERLRMDTIANNIANANTTRAEDGQPYRRRVVALAERGTASGFAGMLSRFMAGNPLGSPAASGGVQVTAILVDRRPFKVKFDPSHPDADANGYVQLPNIDVMNEMVDLMTASRAYEANVTALNAAKAMMTRALEIGR